MMNNILGQQANIHTSKKLLNTKKVKLNLKVPGGQASDQGWEQTLQPVLQTHLQHSNNVIYSSTSNTPTAQ